MAVSRRVLRRLPRRIVGGGLAATVLAMMITACGSEDAPPSAPSEVTLNRAQETTVPFRADVEGEVVLDVTTAAPGVSWGTAGFESAVVSVDVDGTYTTDVVIPASFSIRRSLALGHLPAGEHTLRLRFADDRSASGATSALLNEFAFRTISPDDPAYAAAANAPIIYGRTVDVSIQTTSGTTGTTVDGRFQNAVTDAPLVSFYSEFPSAISGHRLLTYSMIWSNEDEGTTTPALMAKWGRTTDIEWTYQVEVDGSGTAVPGSAVIQAPDNVSAPFTGRYEGSHPVLQVCTLSNNICNDVDGEMRFALPAGDLVDQAAEARERVMDRNPWTYWVMSQEVVREGKVTDAPRTDETDLISEPRNYLYLVIRKNTLDPPNRDDAWIGLSVGVRLSGGSETYRSHRAFPAWSIDRDLPAATAIELPPGTVAEDIASIQATRMVGAGHDTGARVQVEAIERAFFLGPDGLPQESFLFTPAKATLTPSAPTATLFRRSAGSS